MTLHGKCTKHATVIPNTPPTASTEWADRLVVHAFSTSLFVPPIEVQCLFVMFLTCSLGPIAHVMLELKCQTRAILMPTDLELINFPVRKRERFILKFSTTGRQNVLSDKGYLKWWSFQFCYFWLQMHMWLLKTYQFWSICFASYLQMFFWRVLWMNEMW